MKKKVNKSLKNTELLNPYCHWLTKTWDFPTDEIKKTLVMWGIMTGKGSLGTENIHLSLCVTENKRVLTCYCGTEQENGIALWEQLREWIALDKK